MSKKKLLICMTDYPFPARKNGISIRYYPIIEHAAKTFDIHLIAFTEGAVSDEQLMLAQPFCERISIYARKRESVSLFSKIKARLWSLLPGNLPYKFVRYDKKNIVDFLKKETGSFTYEVALCVLIDHLHLIKENVQAKRYTLDVIDSPYSTFLRSMKRSITNLIDAHVLERWERDALDSVDFACYISPLDRQIGAGKSQDDDKVGIIPNGLFMQDYSSERNPDFGKSIGYLGHMGYSPNIKAALRLFDIFRNNQANLSDAKLIIIGRDPAPEIMELANNPRVIVTGTVENIWPYINSINVFVFPMEIGSGQQNKLLEAMAAGIPVISTGLGNSGIGAIHNQQIIIANTDEDIANAIGSIINDENRQSEIGQAGKRFVQERYSWPSILTRIDETLLNIKNIL